MAFIGFVPQYLEVAVWATRSLPPRGRRRHDSVHPQIDHELAVVVADLVQRSLPERGAGDGAVAERELHGLEALGVGQRRNHLLGALERLLQQADEDVPERPGDDYAAD